MKKWSSIVLMLCMMLGICTVTVSAQEATEQEPRSGYMYDNGQWIEVQKHSVGDAWEEAETAVVVSENTIAENSVSGNTIPAANQCGNSLYWALDASGVMTISGTGDMWDFRNDADYFDYHECPWKDRRSEIKSVKFESGITYIGADAFTNCTNLKKVTFTDTIVVLGSFAFYGCENLENFVLPAKLQTLGQQAFDGCKKITKVVIPDTVTFLDGQIFHGADSLVDLYIGGNKDVPSYIFAEDCLGQCISLEEIKVSPDNIALTAVDGVLYSKMKEYLVQYPQGKKDKTLVLPSTLRRAGQFAAEGALYLEEVVFPEGLIEVGVASFRYMPKLKYLSYPSTIKTVESDNGTFCKEIVYIENKSGTKIKLPTGNASIWVDTNDTLLIEMGKGIAYKKGTVSCVAPKKSTTTLGIGESLLLPLTEIEYWNDEVKENRTDLIFISSKPKVATISKDGTITAKSCGTTTITIKNRYTHPTVNNSFSVTCKIKVKKNIADAKITGIKSKNYTGKAIKQTIKVTNNKKALKEGTDYTVSYKNNKKIGTATVIIKGKGSYAGKVEKTFKIKVKKGAVYTVDKVKYKIVNNKTNGSGTVTLTGVTNSTKIKNFTVEKEVNIGGVNFKITTIGAKAFKNCKKLKKVVIGENVKTIGKEAFLGDKQLKNIVVKGKKLKSVGKDAIKNISARAKIEVPSSKLKAYKKMFKKCGGYKKTMTVVGKK